jgi:aspartate oxidase
MNDDLEQARRELAAAQARVRELETELDHAQDSIIRFGDLLRATANALKGEPDPRMLHSTHDLPEWGEKARAVAMGCMAGTAPGAGDAEFTRFVHAMHAWRELYSRDLVATAQALAGLDK